jgi:hypothetical protein
MSQNLDASPAAIGIDIGKNSFHIVGQNQRGAIVLRQKWSRGQVEARLANLPPCRIGMEACVGAHHLSRTLKALGHDARLMPAKVCAPVFQRSKERLSRCGSDRRGGTTPNHEVRRNQDGRPARLAGAAPGARAVCRSAHGHHQSDPRLHVGARNRGAARAAFPADRVARHPGDANRSVGSSRQRLRATDDGPGHRPDHLERDGGRDRHRRCVLERPRLRRLARARAETAIDRRPHDPRQHIEARQSLFAQSVRSGRLGTCFWGAPGVLARRS